MGAFAYGWDYAHGFTFWRLYECAEGWRCSYVWSASERAWQLGAN